MGESSIVDILEAHRVSDRRGPRGARPARVALRADHVVIEGHAAVLALRSFETLNLDRHAAELALACAEENPFAPRGAEDDRGELERMARRRGLVLSRTGNGSAHHVYMTRFAAPGRLVLATSDSLTACGALGALALRVSPTEAAAALAGAAIERPWPDSLRVRFFGRPPTWLSGDDVALELERRLAYAPSSERVLEIELIESGGLRFTDRVAIAMRAARLDVIGVLFPSDEVTRGFLKAQGREADWKALAPTSLTEGEGSSLDLDFSDFEPSAAPPGGSDVLRLRDLGEAPVGAVWIGSEASLTDLRRVAEAWTGLRVAEGVDCFVSLGSRQLHESAARAGVLATLRSAGARIQVPLATPRPRPGPEIALACGAPGAREAGWHETGVSTCALAAVAAVVTDPRQRPVESGDPSVAETYVVVDRLVERPLADAVPLEEPARNGSWPRSPRITGPLRGTVLIRLGDHVGVDRILPWGARVRPVASDIGRLSGHLFSTVDPGFAARSRAEGQGWVVAGRALGAGAPREEIALVAVTLGVRGMMALTFAPEFRRLLRQHGLLALRFGRESDPALIALGDELEIPDLPEGLEEGKPLVVRNLTRGVQVAVHHDLDEAGVEEVREGGLLASLRRAMANGGTRP